MGAQQSDSIIPSVLAKVGWFAAREAMMVWWAKLRGVEFYPDRRWLDAAHPLTQELEKIECAWCCWLAGRKQFSSGEQLEKIERLLLPNPESASLKYFEANLPDKRSLVKDIEETTRQALEREEPIETRWTDQFCGSSWWIADPREPTGFVHVEILFPYSFRDKRPGFRVYRKKQEKLFKELVRVYEELWKASKSPNL